MGLSSAGRVSLTSVYFHENVMLTEAPRIFFSSILIPSNEIPSTIFIYRSNARIPYLLYVKRIIEPNLDAPVHPQLCWQHHLLPQGAASYPPTKHT